MPSLQSLLQIVREVSAVPFNELSNAGSLLISVVNSFISEDDVARLADELGIVVNNEFRQFVFEVAAEVILSIPNVHRHLENCVRLRIIMDRWLSNC